MDKASQECIPSALVLGNSLQLIIYSRFGQETIIGYGWHLMLNSLRDQCSSGMQSWSFKAGPILYGDIFPEKKSIWGWCRSAWSAHERRTHIFVWRSSPLSLWFIRLFLVDGRYIIWWMCTTPSCFIAAPLNVALALEVTSARTTQSGLSFFIEISQGLGLDIS